MLKIGQWNRLRVIKERSSGYYLDGGPAGDILMPARHQPENCDIGTELKVFVFHDSEGRLTATVKGPVAQVGEVAWLQAVGKHRVGTFMDWGLTKDLLVPPHEQFEEMGIGKFYAVEIYLDDYQRIMGSSHLTSIKEHNQGRFKVGQAVDVLIVKNTDMGFKAVIEHSHWGILYHNELFQSVRPGQALQAHIQRIREDGRIDLNLKKPGYNHAQTDALGQRILDSIDAHGGQLPFNDKAAPEVIKDAFGVSKRSFKQAVGNLYKQRLIRIDSDGLHRT